MLNPRPQAAPSAVGDVLAADALDRLRELDPQGAGQLLQRVFGAFQASIARLLPQLREASAAGDLASVNLVAHTLKSSSASIGATSLAQICGEIESMIRLHQTGNLAARVDAMCAEVEVVSQALSRFVDANRP
jgi:HPt (histidine-containing phosphotransfer) domain-containing protein